MKQYDIVLSASSISECLDDQPQLRKEFCILC